MQFDPGVPSCAGVGQVYMYEKGGEGSEGVEEGYTTFKHMYTAKFEV